jgi:hypothetical protein
MERLQNIYRKREKKTVMTSQETLQQEIENLQQKMQLAETAQDVWYIIDRVAQAIHNDQDLGKYIRKISKQELNKTLHETR